MAGSRRCGPQTAGRREANHGPRTADGGRREVAAGEGEERGAGQKGRGIKKRRVRARVAGHKKDNSDPLDNNRRLRICVFLCT